MNRLLPISFATLVAMVPSTALSQSVDQTKQWCEEALWTPVIVPPRDKHIDQAALIKKHALSYKTVYTLSLSGGGYRAMLFHVGTLHRLNDERLLGKLNIVSSVSGGSITAALLAHRWDKLDFDDKGYAKNLKEVIEQPLRKLADQTASVPSVLVGLLPFVSAPEILSRKLDELLFDDGAGRQARLADIGFGQAGQQKYPRPVFIFMATNLQTGELWQLRANAIGGPQTGWTVPGEVSLADAVVASAGFPPFFAPLKLDLPSRSHKWVQCWENRDNPFGADPRHEPTRAIPAEKQDSFRAQVYLADGGIVDNLGVSSIEEINRVRGLRLGKKKELLTVNLISDGGAATPMDPRPSTNWIGVFSRVTGLMSDQPNDLRGGNIVRGESQKTLTRNNDQDFTENHCEPNGARAPRGEDRHAGSDGAQYSDDPSFTSGHYPAGEGREFDETTSGRPSADDSDDRRDSYAYWSIRRLPKIHYNMSCPVRLTDKPWMTEEVLTLASEKTDLAKLETPLQTRLINWGYLSAHHGLPYISALYRPSQRFIERCRIPSALSQEGTVFPLSAKEVACVFYHKPGRNAPGWQAMESGPD